MSLTDLDKINSMSSLNLQKLRARAAQGQAESQFLLSQLSRQNRDLDGMHHWLQQACIQGYPDALDVLGHCLEKGVGIARNYVAALNHYDRAIEKDSMPAAFHKAELLYKSKQGPANEELICDLLVTAAASDFIPALRAIGYLAMQNTPSREMGIRCLRRATLQADPVSAFNLAWCLLQGRDGEVYEQQAKHCLQLAAGAHYPSAEALLKTMHDVEAIPVSSVEKLDLDASFSLYPEAWSIDRQQLCADPAISVFSDVLNSADRAYLMFLSRPYLKRANVIDPDSQEGGMVSQVRTSMSTYIPFGLVDIIARYAELKIVCGSGEKLGNSEPMSILYYTRGQYYRPHVDYFDPKLKVSEELLKDGGQRTASAVTYLSAPDKGGGTSFPRLKLAVPAVAGSTLWFRNCFDNGEVDDRSLHAGDPVEQGEKWVVTKWFREQPTQYLEF